MSERITKPKAGDIYAKGQRIVAGCDDKHNGRWHCLTHNKTFENQFQKDSHIHQGTHCLAWLCNEHGFEVP